MTDQDKSAPGLILALWAAGLGAAAQFAKVAVIFPSLQEIYPEAGASLGFVVSVISFLGVAFGLFAGLIVARGARKMLLLALLLGAAVSIWQATFPAIPVMLASRVLEGISHLIIVVAAPTLIAQYAAPRHRPLALTLWSTFFGVSFALVAWLGLPLIAIGGPTLLFVIHAAYMAAIALLLMLILPGRKVMTGPPPRLGLKEVLARHIEIYRSPFLAAPALGWLFYTLTFVSLLAILPGFVAAEHRGMVAIVMPVAGIATGLTIGVALLRRTEAINVVLLGFGLAALASVAMAVFPESPWPAICLAATLGLVQGASFTAVPQLNPSAEGQSFANGAMAQMGNLGNACGTPLLFVLSQAFGHDGIVGFLIASYALGILVHLTQVRRRSAAAAQRPGAA